MNTLPAGFYPFWFWNGDVTREEIRWQVAQMASQGIRGFFIHSRQGLKNPPYLSDTFLDRIEDAVLAAQEHGLIVHLYDEYPYPSGVAGGEVILGEPELWATELYQQTWDVESGPIRRALPPGKVLSLLAFPVKDGQIAWNQPLDLASAVGPVLMEEAYQETGLTRYNQKRFFANKPHPVFQTTLPPGRWHLVASLQQVVERHKYWGQFADVLNPRAVQRFIELTHERYFRRLGKYFGNTIRWIFTDEVMPGWSACLPREFQREYGYDLLPLLPALQDPSHPGHERVSVDLHRLKLKLFSQAFEEPVAEWCRQHGLMYAAEKPSLRYSQLRFQDIPGCEPGHVKAGGVLDLLQPALRGNAKATASAAYFYGKDGALDECYHSLGWSATLEDIRWMADAQLLLGIRYLVPHGFFYITHNLRKHDAPPSLFFQAPYWPFFHLLSERVERIRQAFEGTFINARLAVIDPTAGLPTAAGRADYERLMHALMGAHLDFHVVDTDLLVQGKLDGERIILRDVAFEVVLVPTMTHYEASLTEWLDRFTQAGGRVIHCPPGFQAEAFMAELAQCLQPSLRLKTAGVENPGLWSVQRCAKGRQVWLVLNITGEPVEVEVEAGIGLNELPLAEGGRSHLENHQGKLVRKFEPFEACLLESIPTAQYSDPAEVISIHLSEPVEVCPLNANLARLYDWRLSLLDEHGQAWQTETVQAIPLANQLEQGGFRFAPRFSRVFGTPPELSLPEFHLRYECAFHNGYAGKVELVMEPGSIVGDWSLKVNQSAHFTAQDFLPTHHHVRGSLALDLTGLLLDGLNTLTIDLATSQVDGGLLNPLYLAGDFGVTLDPLRLVGQSTTGRFEAYRENLLPFYAGEIEYRFTSKLDSIPEGPTCQVRLEVPAACHEACEIFLNGGNPRAFPWGPLQMEVGRAELRSGRNEITIKVYTGLIRSFEGQEFDHISHRYINIQ